MSSSAEKNNEITVTLRYNDWTVVGAGLVLMVNAGSPDATRLFKDVSSQVIIQDTLAELQENPLGVIDAVLKDIEKKDRPEGA